MATSTHFSYDSHSTTNTGATWSNKRIAVTALFCAMALICSFIEIPIFPPAPWLEYDPSGVIALVAGLVFGPVTGTLVAVLSWLLHLLFAFNPWGVLMAIAANVALIVPCSLVYGKLGATKGMLAGMGVGAVVSLAVCIVMNLLVTPLYTAVTVDAVVSMIVPILVPFNVMKIVLNCVLCALVVKPVSKVLSK